MDPTIKPRILIHLKGGVITNAVADSDIKLFVVDEDLLMHANSGEEVRQLLHPDDVERISLPDFDTLRQNELAKWAASFGQGEPWL